MNTTTDTIDAEMQTEIEKARLLAAAAGPLIQATPEIVDRARAELMRMPLADLLNAAKQFYPAYHGNEMDERETIVMDILDAAFTAAELGNWRTSKAQPGE